MDDEKWKIEQHLQSTKECLKLHKICKYCDLLKAGTKITFPEADKFFGGEVLNAYEKGKEEGRTEKEKEIFKEDILLAKSKLMVARIEELETELKKERDTKITCICGDKIKCSDAREANRYAIEKLKEKIAKLEADLDATEQLYGDALATSRCPVWQCGGNLKTKDIGGEDGWKTPDLLCENCHSKWFYCNRSSLKECDGQDCPRCHNDIEYACKRIAELEREIKDKIDTDYQRIQLNCRLTDKIAELEKELKDYKECASTEANEFDEMKLLAEKLAEDNKRLTVLASDWWVVNSIELLKEAKNALLCPVDTDTLACGCKMCSVRRKIEKILEGQEVK